MAYIQTNPNPKRNMTGDCVIRAISIAENKSWDDVFLELMLRGFDMKELPSENSVWSAHLRDLGYSRHIIPDTCPDCYTVENFAQDHPEGDYILATGSHIVAIKSGDVLDAWDSLGEVPIFYFTKEE